MIVMLKTISFISTRRKSTHDNGIYMYISFSNNEPVRKFLRHKIIQKVDRKKKYK